MMMSKIVKFILSHSKKHRTFTEVCKDVIADTMRLCFMLRHAGYPEEKYSACVSTVARVAGFPCSTRIPISTNLRQFLALFQSEFFFMDRASIYI